MKESGVLWNVYIAWRVRKWRAERIREAKAAEAERAAAREAAERQLRAERDAIETARHEARVQQEIDAANLRDGFTLRPTTAWVPLTTEEAMERWRDAAASERAAGWAKFWEKRGYPVTRAVDGSRGRGGRT